jgi:hypothetical protein
VNPGVMSPKDHNLRTVLGVSTLRKEAKGSSNTLVTMCQIAWCHNLQENNLITSTVLLIFIAIRIITHTRLFIHRPFQNISTNLCSAIEQERFILAFAAVSGLRAFLRL